MRITDNMALNAVLQGNARTTQRLSKAAREASTGERVGAPSDDPVAWTAAHGHDARIARMETRAQTTSRAAGDLELAESTLASVGDMIQQARELALTTANGAVDAQTRSNVAAQVSQIRDAVLGQMNTRGASGYLFGGTRTDRAPFDAAGTFSGNDTPVSVEVADGVTARANASARSGPSLTKWNVVPPGRTQGSRFACVNTNTGVWNGASSGQATSPWSNIRLPMMLAPMRSVVLRSRSLTGPVSPPGPSLRFWRKCSRLRIHPIIAPHFAPQPMCAGSLMVMPSGAR
jgi:flagellin-like hook-associated protein FlgL